ncbi:MAG TPA: DUF1015 family protein [Gammaproteobacteria bacterium]|nr:DUF1015 family protein [Gammaproteobacteria bacterium]
MPSLVSPFRALRPRPDRAADVIAPPYDVVSSDEARALAAGRPASFLHISRPEIDLPPGTSPYSDEAYARGAANLAKLLDTNVLVRDDEPGYYVYRIDMQGRTQTGIALAASVAAYAANRIRRHELTRPDKETDRVRNIDSLNAQTGPVLLAYRANAELHTLVHAAAAGTPLMSATGPNETRHTIWRVAEPELVAAIGAAFDGLDALYIADGHHRSAAALRVAQARRAAASGQPRGAANTLAPRASGGSKNRRDPSYESFLAVAFPHDEMRILAYNRIVHDLNGLTIDALLARLSESFDIQPSPAPVEPARRETFGLFVGGRWYRLEIRAALVPHADPVASLDVSLLQDRALAPILGIGDPRTDKRIDFVGGVRGLRELEDRVASGRAAAAFSMRATRMEQLMAVADANRLMPPKSTWFEPKLADGLLSHVLD